MIYIQLFFEFFKIGLFAIGGGMATLPFLYDMADKTGWFTIDQLSNIIAISQSTPGPVGVNMATYVGYITAGVFGGIISTIGLVTVPIIIIIIIAYFLGSFRENKYIDSAFYGLRPASTALIAAAGSTLVMLTFVKEDLFKHTGKIINLFDWKSMILAIIIFVLTNYVKSTKKFHPAIFIAGSALIGIIFKFAGL